VAGSGVTDTAEPRRPARAGPTTWLGGAATASLFYPLLLCIVLYGEWLCAWAVLGHQPRPSLDDPKSIAVSAYWHNVTAVAFMGLLPVSWVAFALNLLHGIVRKLHWLETLTRVIGVVVAWAIVVGLLYWDPGRVVHWWFD